MITGPSSSQKQRQQQQATQAIERDTVISSVGVVVVDGSRYLSEFVLV